MPQGEENMSKAIEQIRALAQDARFSSIYETDPVGQHQHAKYKNCVGQVVVSGSFDYWKQFFKQMERDMGRDEASKLQGNVPLDIDIVVWNDDVVRPKDLEASYTQIGLKEIEAL